MKDSATKYKTIRQWDDPSGQRHEIGEVAEIDPAVVFDLTDLIAIGTVAVDAPPAPPAPPALIASTKTTPKGDK